jgi:hypothetical protein
MADLDGQRQAICQELERIEENARYTSVTHFISADIVRRLHFWVVGPIPIILGGIAAWNGFTKEGLAEVSGALGVLAGVTGSVLSFWNLSDVRTKHQAAGAAFKAIEHDARRARLVDCPFGELTDLRRRLEDLAERYNKLGESSVHTGRFAFRRAQKLIASGVYRNTVDEPAGGTTPAVPAQGAPSKLLKPTE